MTMQPNNKCTCPSGDGSLRWPCPAHPAAAAHEAVGEVYQGSARRPQAKLNAELPVGTKLYATPVTAAPDDALLVQAALATATTWREQASILKTGRKTLIRCAAELEAMVAAIHTRSTPAVPGIDLEPLIAIRNRLHQLSAANDLGDGWADVVIELMGDVQTLIDASPKGGINERERFEAWARGASYCGGNIDTTRHPDNNDWYACPTTAMAWRCWKAAMQSSSPKGGSEAPAVENVAEDTYHAISEVLRTEGGWSVLEHVEYCRELIWEARVALGRDGANADTNHRHRGLWVKLGRCLEGFAPGSDEALSELSKCDCQNPCPETGAALVSMACPIHNDLPAAQASDAEVRP
jgi:hypothetical protein